MKADGRATVRRWARRGAILALLLSLVGFGSLEAVRFVAHRRGTSAVDLPAASEIRTRADGADYTDAYRAPLEDNVTLDALSFGGGPPVVRTDREALWEGRAPGLRFIVSYHLETDGPRFVTLSTAVFYESTVGRLYFFFVRPVHRRGVPFMVSRIGRGAVGR